MIIPLPNELPLELLRRCGGYYKCPKDKEGKRLGKLVVYAGTYEGGTLHFVGDEYANYAGMEQEPLANFNIAERLAPLVAPAIGENTVICGVPTGGILLGPFLALALAKLGKQVRFVALEKTNIRQSGGLEISHTTYDLKAERHSLIPGETVVLVEDIVNNATNTNKAVLAVKNAGCEVALLACFLNRSVMFENFLTLPGGQRLEITSLMRRKIPQFRQDDPFVADDVRIGNVCSHVKPEWSALMESMKLDQSGEQGGTVNWQAGGQ